MSLPEPIQSIIAQYTIEDEEWDCLNQNLDTIRWVYQILRVKKDKILKLEIFEWFLSRHTPEIVRWLVIQYQLTNDECLGKNYASFWTACMNRAHPESIEWAMNFFKLNKSCRRRCLGLNNNNLCHIMILRNNSLLSQLATSFRLAKTDFKSAIYYLSSYAHITKFGVIAFLKWFDSKYRIVKSDLTEHDYWPFRNLQSDDIEGLDWLIKKLEPNDQMIWDIKRVFSARDPWNTHIVKKITKQGVK